MREPTEENIAAALRAHPRAYALPIGDESIGLDVGSLLLRPLDAKSWAPILDVTWTRGAGDALAATYVDHVLWPPASEADELARTFPELPKEVYNDLTSLAGMNQGKPEITMLTAATDPRVIAKVKVPPAVVADLLEKHQGERLAIVLCPVAKVAVIMLAPSGATAAAADRSLNAAVAAKGGVFAACLAFLRSAVVWQPMASLDALADEFPCIIGDDLFDAYKRLGGGGAARERKSLR